MKKIVEQLAIDALTSFSIEVGDVVIDHPTDFKNGDYSTNIALAYGKKTGKKPLDLALSLTQYLNEHKPSEISKVEIAGPGFINFYLSPQFFADTINRVKELGGEYGKTEQYAGKKIMVEYTDPNPFKIFHIGHLMANTIGESISRLIEWNGAEVKRANYQGDVGRHVALTIWGIRFMKTPFPEDTAPLLERIEYLGKAYALGATTFKDNEAEHMKVVQEINKKIYDQSDAEVNELYIKGREWSLEYFETIYEKLGTKFDFYFFESEVAEDGIAIVKDFLAQGVFEESDGAVVFHAEEHNPKLHTRVFINSYGLPTYEAKELGLATKKYALYPFDTSITITGNEQDDFFKVVLEALKVMFPDIGGAMKHISHGMLTLPTGKMSSRTGDVVAAEDLLKKIYDLVLEKVKDRELSEEEKKKIADIVGIAALKYVILKQAPGRDIVFDFDKSISFEGDSGPYVQYAYTRAQSVLEKARGEGIQADTKEYADKKTDIERLLHRFPELVERAGKEYAPQLIVTYMVDVAGAFNSFYAQEKIVDKDDAHSAYKVALTDAVTIILKNGLYLLGIKVPEKM